MIGIRISQRADGMTEIEVNGGPEPMHRYRTRAEVDAFLAGFRACHGLVRESVRHLDVIDDRPIPRAPTS